MPTRMTPSAQAALRARRRQTRRLVCAGVVLTALVGIVAVRLYDVQVVKAASLNAQSAQARDRTRTIPGIRGNIVDANGNVLATTVTRYTVSMSPVNAAAVQKKDQAGFTSSVAKLADALGQPMSTFGPLVTNAITTNPTSKYALLVKDVDTAGYQRLLTLGLDWIFTDPTQMRQYPSGALAANVTGFVGSDGTPLAGLELTNNACLAGTDGKMSYMPSLSDWIEVPGSAHVTTPAKPGGTLKLTLNRDLQYAAQQSVAQRIKDTGAPWITATVMDAKTGALLAVADAPTLDANDPGAADPNARGSLALTAQFEPGSIYKPITVASLLDSESIQPDAKVTAPYSYAPAPGVQFTDASPHPTENFTLSGMLVNSSNVGVSKFGEHMPAAARYDTLQKFGFGTPTAVNFPGEVGGSLHGSVDQWDEQTFYASMFGQGVTASTIQMASAYQAIANGGVRTPASLVAGCTQADGTVTDQPPTGSTQVISAQTASEVTTLMEQVYTQSSVGLRNAWTIPGYRVALKTGTAQVADGKGGYLPGYLMSVTGFAPANDPRFIVSVHVMQPQHIVSTVAPATVFRDIMSAALKEFRVPPDGTAAPKLPLFW